MIMFLCVFMISLVIVRLLIAATNYFSFAYLPVVANVTGAPFVSILIPARNEEENIGALLKQLSQLKYGKLEIIVYNDHSTDNTESIVTQWVAKQAPIKIMNGAELPQGWLGKNHACHQLAGQAKGDILLFLDADVSVNKDIIERSISHLQKHKLHLLSIFPRQIFKSFGEKISVPLLNYILLSLLPLFLIRKSKRVIFSAANGQFMMFKANTYKTLWPHESFKSHRVEDIAIIRMFKQKGLASDTRLGDNDISCRMYGSLDTAIVGFTKNIFQFFGDSKLVTVCFGLVTTLGPFLIYFYLGAGWLIAYVVGTLSIRLFVSLASKQPVVQNILLAIPQHLVFLFIIIKGLINNKQRKILWKGRNILQD